MTRENSNTASVRAFARTLTIGAVLIAGGSFQRTHAEDLIDVFRTALENDATYLAAKAANVAAQEAAPQARAELLPDLNLTAGVTRFNQNNRRVETFTTGGVVNFTNRSLDLTLSQPLYRMDRWIALEQADLEIAQANADLIFAQQELFTRVSERYFEVLRSLDELEFRRAEREAIGQQLNQAEQRFEVGLIAITDVREAKAGFDLAVADTITAENALDDALEALRETTGQYYERLNSLGEQMPLAKPEPNDIDAWTATALQQNLQLVSARFEAERAKEEIRLRRAGHLPTLDLVGGYSRQQNTGGRSGPTARDDASVGVELNVPIYSGGLVLSQTREARALYQQALDQQEQQRRAAQRQTRDAFLGVLSGTSRVEALNQAVISTQSALEAIEAGFEVGTRTSIDVLDAQRDVFRAKRDFSGARYDYLLDIIRLKEAAGILRDLDLVELSALLSETRNTTRPASERDYSRKTTSNGAQATAGDDSESTDSFGSGNRDLLDGSDELLADSLRATREWLEQADENSYTLQVLATRNPQALERLLADLESTGDLDQIRVTMLERDGADWYLLMYGSFATQEEARFGLESLPSRLSSNGAYPRSLRGVLAESGSAAAQ